MNLHYRLLRVNKNRKKEQVEDECHNKARIRINLMLILTDTISFLAAGLIALLFRVLLGDAWRTDLFPQVIPLALISILFFGFVDLYPGLGVNAVDELRKLTTVTSFVMLILTGLSFWFRNAQDYSRLTLGLAWLFSIPLLPLSRDIIRSLGIHFGFWGEPVVLIGYGSQGKWALDFFQQNPKLGLKPALILDFTRTDMFDDEDDVIKAGDVLSLEYLSTLTGLCTALVVLSDLPDGLLKAFSNNRQGGYRRLILLPSLDVISSYGVNSFDFGGVLGLEVRHNLLNRPQKILKRFMDVFIAFWGCLGLTPFVILLALIQQFDSPGPLFYGHPRIGKRGIVFKAWKLRTMVPNADQILKDYLDKNPDVRSEWEQNFKLKNDPRITRVGNILRRFSLDELPQLFNVLKGEMSLVGPRPIVRDEVQYYGEIFDPYTWVKPGITGLWQVSGRSDVSYDERVRLDEYYIRNWSIWLDVLLLARTVGTVIRRQGAY